MPELPEVETVRLGLEQQTVGWEIARAEVLRERAIAAPTNPDEFCRSLAGTRLDRWQRRGKYLLADLSHCHPGGPVSAGVLGVHLRMTGQFHWLEQERPPCSHTRVRFWDQQGRELRFIDSRSFGQLWWVPPGHATSTVITGLSRLGPEPFDPAFSPEHLQQRLRGSKRAIKTALLDQALVAGVGNIYADESLFMAGIRPHTPAGKVRPKQLASLHRELVRVLQVSIGAGGTTFSDFRDLRGTNGNYGGQAWVYRRSGQPCRRCGATIRRDRLAGRSSHWCPTCQR